MLRNYLVIAWRNMARHRLYSLINVTGLAVGMACCVLIAIFVRNELSVLSTKNVDKIAIWIFQ